MVEGTGEFDPQRWGHFQRSLVRANRACDLTSDPFALRVRADDPAYPLQPPIARARSAGFRRNAHRILLSETPWATRKSAEITLGFLAQSAECAPHLLAHAREALIYSRGSRFGPQGRRCKAPGAAP